MRAEYKVLIWREKPRPYNPDHGWSMKDNNDTLTHRIEWYLDDVYTALARLARSKFERIIAHRFRPLYDPTDK